MTTEFNLNFTQILQSCARDIGNSLTYLLNAFEEINDQMPTAITTTRQSFDLRYETFRVNHSLTLLSQLYQINQNNYKPLINDNNLYDFIDDILIQNNTLTTLAHVDITVDCDENLQWAFDERLFTGVLSNILANVTRYTKDKIKITVTQSKQMLTLMIEDNGPGYPDIYCLPTPPHFDCYDTHIGLTIHYTLEVAGLHTHQAQSGSIKIDNKSALGGGRFIIHIP